MISECCCGTKKKKSPLFDVIQSSVKYNKCFFLLFTVLLYLPADGAVVLCCTSLQSKQDHYTQVLLDRIPNEQIGIIYYVAAVRVTLNDK